MIEPSDLERNDTSVDEETRRFFMGIAGIFSGIGILAYLVCGASVLAVVVVGIWDSVVWLVKADWRTTEFKVILPGIGLAALSGALGGVSTWIGFRIKDWIDSFVEDTPDKNNSSQPDDAV